jgi:hypothetical protein
VTEPELTDPQLSAFFAADPATLLERGHPDPAEEAERGLSAGQVAAIGVAIAAAFLVVRRLIADDMAGAPPPDDPTGAAKRLWARHAPVWLRMVVPAITHAYSLGRVSGLTPAELEQLAGDYAAGLGDYVNDTSAQALADGFTAQLNQRWSERVAWHRAAAGYGLDRQQMLGHVSGLMKGAESGGVDLVPDAARALVDKALLIRADLLGQSEAHRAVESGKAIAWLVQQQHGVLPAEALKRWRMHPGELTCGTCMLLEGQAVPLAESFTLADGSKLFAPGAHPRCHCHLELAYPAPEEVRKDAPGDPYDRDRRGHFARHEQRQRRPAQATTAERNPVVDDLLARARAQAAEVDTAPVADDPFARPGAGDPFARAETGDPFARAGDPFAQSGDPFAQSSDPFKRGAAQPSAAERLNARRAFDKRPGGRTERAGRLIRRVIMVPPLPKRQGKSDPYYLPEVEMRNLLWEQNYDGNFFDDLAEPRIEHGDEIDFGDYHAEAMGMWQARRDWNADLSPGNLSLDLGHPDYERANEPPSPLAAVRSSTFHHLTDSVSDDIAAFWEDRSSELGAVRQEALDNAADVIGGLHTAQVQAIYYLAGFDTREAEDHARDRILDAVAEDPTGPLAAAYADFVAYTEPGMTGEDGKELARQMHEDFMGAPEMPEVPEIFVFDSGFDAGDGQSGAGESFADLKGKYRVSEIEYHSAHDLLGSDAPPGLAGFRLVYLKPPE